MKYLSDIFTQNGGSCKPLFCFHEDFKKNTLATTNISIASYKGNIVSNTRLTNYMYIPQSATDILMYIPLCSGDVISHNIIGPIGSNQVLYKIMGENKYKMGYMRFAGLEDVRLVVWNDTLYGIGSRPCVVENKVILQLIEYNEDFSISRSWFINTDKKMEKNWQPIEDHPFTFMYDPDKSATVTLNIDELQEADDLDNPTIINNISTPEFTFNLSGSTQVIRLDDELYVSICHTSHRYVGNDSYGHWVYNHYFVLYDNDMNKLWVSEPFRFVSDCMEFSCGMCKDTDNIYISFSMYDGITHLLSIPFDKFQDILTNMRNTEGMYEGMPNNEYIVDCYNSNEIAGSSAFVYMAFLECVHRLDNIDGMDKMLNLHVFGMDGVRDALLLYFITRRKDCDFLLKKLT